MLEIYRVKFIQGLEVLNNNRRGFGYEEIVIIKAPLFIGAYLFV